MSVVTGEKFRPEDIKENEFSLARLPALERYRTNAGDKLWVLRSQAVHLPVFCCPKSIDQEERNAKSLGGRRRP